MHLHEIKDQSGELVELVKFCSDACNRDWAGLDYQGWSGCHETEFTTYCVACGVVIPGFDACEHQTSNVVVNRFLSDEGERCEHGNWIQLPLQNLKES